MSEKINIRGVYFNNVSLEEAIDTLISAIENKSQCALFTPNSEIVQMCIEKPEMYEIINSADLIGPDGIGVVKAGRILGTPFEHGKVAGVEVGEGLIKRLSETEHTVYLLGGKPGIAKKAAEVLTERYPGIKFVGCRDGYFAKTGEETDAVIEEINKTGASAVFVCLGCPAQEKWIYENRSRFTSAMALLALGGSLDAYSGNVRRAPKIFIKLGLEWFYRLLCQPSRIGRMMKLPKFYFGTWMYKIKNK